MYKLCVFAGTTEGREIAEFLRTQAVTTHVCVATQYGGTLLAQGENLHVHATRMDCAQMCAFFTQEQFDLVIDATHPYEDVLSVSVHGRERDICADVRENRRIFALVGGENGMGALCASLCAGALADVRVCIGERLSYPDERIHIGTAREFATQKFDTLSVALIENDFADAPATHGLADEAFARVERVPMTKSEVRSVCISKLALTERSVAWDIGAGSGSVAIEMALRLKHGAVWAIERKDDALALLRENVARFGVRNLTCVAGIAPEACASLPAPTHAFIGGSSGNMHQIIAMLLKKNPNVRIVATAISLESVAELTDCLKAFPFAQTEVVCMNVARSRKAGAYQLMMGQNPIYIFTMQGGNAQ